MELLGSEQTQYTTGSPHAGAFDTAGSFDMSSTTNNTSSAAAHGVAAQRIASSAQQRSGACGGSPSGALGNITNIATPLGGINTVTGEVLGGFFVARKWELRAVARRVSPERHRVHICMHNIRADRGEVEVKAGRGETGRGAYFAGLMTCGSVWVCPVCAAKIQAQRSVEVRAVIDAWVARGGAVSMLTLTAPHTRDDVLEDLLERFTSAQRLLTKGSSWARFKDRHGVRGYVKALEVTYGQENGWHVHSHWLLFSDSALGGYARSVVLQQWRSACKRASIRGRLSAKHAVTLQDGAAVKTYVTKMGAEYTWSSEDELVRSHSKRGRGLRFTPFDLLALQLGEGSEALRLDGVARWIEYCEAFHGRMQMSWSRVGGTTFRKWLLGEAALERTDEELAASVNEADALLGAITLQQWRVIRRQNLQGDVLAVADLHGVEGLENFLAALPVDDVSGGGWHIFA